MCMRDRACVCMCVYLRIHVSLCVCLYVCLHACACVYVLQESQWLDSVSLLIKDSLEGELIDNLSGSVFHHYCPLPTCRDCRAHSQEVRQTYARKHERTHTRFDILVILFFEMQLYSSNYKCSHS